MLRIEDLKIESRYKRLTLESKEQLKALEKLIVADGEVGDDVVVC